tara:strand:- start:12 stop:590 length:579 start_codon:yes stop_codon:yes gene_type:complete
MKLAMPILLFLSAAVSSSSFALINGTVQVGQRSAKLSQSGSSSDLSGTALKAGVYLDPLPLPVAFGVGITNVTTDKTDLYPAGQGLEVGLELKAWIPFVPVVTPYGIVSYIPYGAIAFEDGLNKSAYEVSGTSISLGVTYPIIPLIAVNLQFTMGTTTLSADNIEVNGVKQPNTPNVDAEFTDILLGVEVGI